MTILVLAPSWFEALERAEESFQFCRGDDRTVIGDGKYAAPFLTRRCKMDISSGSVVEDRVVDEVLEQLFDELRIAADDRWRDVGVDV